MCITNNIINIVFCCIILYSLIIYLDDGKESFINFKNIKRKCNYNYVKMKRTCKKNINMLKNDVNRYVSNKLIVGNKIIKRILPKEINIKF